MRRWFHSPLTVDHFPEVEPTVKLAVIKGIGRDLRVSREAFKYQLRHLSVLRAFKDRRDRTNIIEFKQRREL